MEHLIIKLKQDLARYPPGSEKYKTIKRKLIDLNCIVFIMARTYYQGKGSNPRYKYQ